MSDVDRIVHPTRVSGRAFWVTLVLIVSAIVVFFLVR
jgi:hypothetical protein